MDSLTPPFCCLAINRARKHDGQIVTTVNDRVIHDWTDDDPHGSGWVGLRTYNTDVTYHDWTVSKIA